MSTPEPGLGWIPLGQVTLCDDGMRLVLTGVSSVDEIRRVTGIRLI